MYRHGENTRHAARATLFSERGRKTLQCKKYHQNHTLFFKEGAARRRRVFSSFCHVHRFFKGVFLQQIKKHPTE